MLTVAHDVARTSGFYAWPNRMRCETRKLAEFISICRAASGVNATEEDDDGDDEDAADGSEDREHAADSCCFVCEEELLLHRRAADTSTAESGPAHFRCYHEDCEMQCHSMCLADHFVTSLSISDDDDDSDNERERGGKSAGDNEEVRPERGNCPDCQGELLWSMLEQQINLRADEAPVAQTRHTPSKRRRKVAASKGGNGDELGQSKSTTLSSRSRVCASTELRHQSQSTRDSTSAYPADDTDARFDDSSDLELIIINTNHPERFIPDQPAQGKSPGMAIIDLTLDDD